ncbi:leucyl/phenylalanyl-tRNA--protein transferase [Exilibacterium tricleocarpae]|uniref:Leucyl/phenylalanyl-tRNA--protein transferase n=1 Tax=Exilibacterium tricleocarpae TaxID=2591008 RepID=A0A545T8K7_9GAMM|nr:leucyl/phenylalanyl-tRNA--protein transferase [Exilibacterium tricleocarpae]TQV73546.1 leucyl/phenylalanyl-tRNA--protein transferase [Exilibacterium tricleocarpae]
MSQIPWLDCDHLAFPPLEQALTSPNGLLAAGGDLRPQRLLYAYRRGIFPWYEEGQPILWWSPSPRMVIFPHQLHIARSLRKILRRGRFTVTADTAFERVIEACAGTRRHAGSDEGTWITAAMQRAYCELHRLGHAHSVEVWLDSKLVGGLYGIALGQVFFGESMFSLERDASKVAFVHLVQQLGDWGFQLVDCQVASDHLSSLGAGEISRQRFAQLLLNYVDVEPEINRPDIDRPDLERDAATGHRNRQSRWRMTWRYKND